MYAQSGVASAAAHTTDAADTDNKARDTPRTHPTGAKRAGFTGFSRAGGAAHLKSEKRQPRVEVCAPRTANGQRRHQQRRPVARKRTGQGRLHSRARVFKIKPCTSGEQPHVEASRSANAAGESHTVSRQNPPKSALDGRSSKAWLGEGKAGGAQRAEGIAPRRLRKRCRPPAP